MFQWLVLNAGAAGQLSFMRLLKTIVIRVVSIQTSPQEDFTCKDTLLGVSALPPFSRGFNGNDISGDIRY